MTFKVLTFGGVCEKIKHAQNYRSLHFFSITR